VGALEGGHEKKQQVQSEPLAVKFLRKVILLAKTSIRKAQGKKRVEKDW